MLEAFGEILAELFFYIFGEIFVNLIFEKGLRPVFNFLGSLFKYLFLFWKYSFTEVSKRKGNEIYGGLICLTIIVIVFWKIFNN